MCGASIETSLCDAYLYCSGDQLGCYTDDSKYHSASVFTLLGMQRPQEERTENPPKRRSTRRKAPKSNLRKNIIIIRNNRLV